MSENLLKICQSIEMLDRSSHVGILQILNKKHKHLLNSNKNGIHVNLSEVDEETLAEISDYINYVKFQESNLNVIEEKKEKIKKFL